jgi:glycosyltransferase involved in cell wall biosynthesis
MNILLIAPLPPPITGNSLPVKILYEELNKNHNVDVVNLSKDSYSAGVDSVQRVRQVGRILKDVVKKRSGKDLIYFTISESFAGNMKDLIIYMICFFNRKKIIIHMLGGAGMKDIIDHKQSIQSKLNRFFIKGLGGIIVEGKTQADFFSEVAPRNKIHIVPNFAEDFLFVTTDEIKDNFRNTDPLKILFLSNLLYGKGHNEIVEAYLSLSTSSREKIKIDFAGGFESEEYKKEFLNRIWGIDGIAYHGLVNGSEKKKLYTDAHVFCLPTYYPYEGQPFCILEAYATGCVVITTNHSGIGNIFRDGVNGFEVQKKSVESLTQGFEKIIVNRENLTSLAISNLEIAKRFYNTTIYKSSIKKAFSSIVPGVE